MWPIIMISTLFSVSMAQSSQARLNLLANPLLQEYISRTANSQNAAELNDNTYDLITNLDGSDDYLDGRLDQIKLVNDDTLYGNDVYPLDGWFNGPVVYDTPNSNVKIEDTSDAQLNNLLINYLLDQIEKYDKQKKLTLKRQEQPKQSNRAEVTTAANIPLPIKFSQNKIVSTTHTPIKLASKQFRLIQSGQKEFPLLRPASDSNDRSSQSQPSLPEWPTELDENKLLQEETLMSLKQPKSQSRVTRDVLTAQLDNLKASKTN